MPIGDLLAQISGEPSPTEPTHNSRPPPQKRKADDQVRPPANKIPRTGPSPNTSSKPDNQNGRSTQLDRPLSNVRLSSAPPKSNTNSTAPLQNGRPTPPPAIDTTPRAPPKKGSFAETMARAKAAQSNMGQVGKIQHKRIEKMPSRREREDMKTQKGTNIGKNLAPGGKFSKTPIANGRNGRDAPPGPRDIKAMGKKAPPPEPEKKIKKSATATTGYTGTARPKPSGSKPASRPSAPSSSRYGRGPDRGRYGSGAQYAYVSEEDEEEEERDEYDSDASSDMEAAAFEVDEEEEFATRIAKKEDAEALAEENRLKREKEEKRKRLAAMARARR